MTILKWEYGLDFIEKWNINILNIIFIGLSFLMVFFGSLMSFVEAKLPTSVKQFFRYGKHGVNDKKKNKFMSLLEVPKAWFAHFYIFALILSWWSMSLLIQVSVLRRDLPKYAEIFLDYVAGGRQRKVLIDSTTCFIVMALMCLQCSRRFYETNFVQIFSKKNKINVGHYIVGYLHYVGAILALLANAEGFVRDSTPSALNFSRVTLLQYISIALFIFSWWYQYHSNMILVNLRKDSKTGKVATEKHLLPKGGFFEWVSSPHMLFEIGLYVALLLGFFADSITWWLVVIWVVSNQIYNAVCTHSWYKETFKNYPKKRKAIIPFIL